MQTMTRNYKIEPMAKYVVGGGYIDGYAVKLVQSDDWAAHFDTEDECHQFVRGEIYRFGDDC